MQILVRQVPRRSARCLGPRDDRHCRRRPLGPWLSGRKPAVMTNEDGHLVVKGVIAVDGAKFPALRRALERGRELSARVSDGWAQVAELRRSGNSQAADR